MAAMTLKQLNQEFKSDGFATWKYGNGIHCTAKTLERGQAILKEIKDEVNDINENTAFIPRDSILRDITLSNTNSVAYLLQDVASALRSFSEQCINASEQEIDYTKSIMEYPAAGILALIGVPEIEMSSSGNFSTLSAQCIEAVKAVNEAYRRVTA